MAKDIEYRVEVDTSDSVRDLDKLGKAGKQAGKDIKSGLEDVGSSDRSVQNVRDTLEDVVDILADVESKSSSVAAQLVSDATKEDSQLRQAATAAEALKEALGESADKFDVDAVVGKLNRLGLGFDEIEADAEQLAAAIKRVDDIQLRRVNDGISTTRQSMGQLRDSSDQSRSVLANLAGNAAQDLGELGGVVGTLGVGIGQLAEYAVDGNIALSNLAKVAGPMAALSAAVYVVGQAMAAINAEKAFDEAQVKDFFDALRDGQTVVDHLRETIEETGRLDFETGLFGGGGLLGITSQTQNLIPLFNEIGINYSEFLDLLQDPRGVDRLKEMRDQWLDLSLAAEDDATADRFQANAEAARDAANGLQTYKENTDAAIVSQQEFDEFMSEGASTFDDINTAMSQHGDEVQDLAGLWGILVREMKDGHTDSQQALDAWRELQDILKLDNAEMAEMLDKKIGEHLAEQAELAREKWSENAQLVGHVQEVMQERRDAAREAYEEEQKEAEEAAEAARQATEDVRMWAVAYDGASERADAFARSLADVNEKSNLEEFAEISGVLDPLEDLHQALHDLEDQGIKLSEVDLVPDSWEEIKNMPEELRPVVEAFGNLRTGIQSEFTEAFSQGGMTAAKQWAEDMRRGVVDSIKAMGFDVDEEAAVIAQTLHELGLEDVQIDAVIKASGEDQVRGVIEQVMSAVGDIPPEVALAVAVQAEDDPLGALKTLIAATHLTVPAELLPVLDEMEEAITGVEDADHTVSFLADDGGSISEMSGDIDTATEDRTTQVIVPKSPSLGQMETMINAVARERTVKFNAKSDNAGAMNSILNSVAADRTADIFAQVHNAGDAERRLDNVAEDRYADIFVRVHGAASAAAAVNSAASPGMAPAPEAALVGATAAPAPVAASSGGGVVTLAAPALAPIIVSPQVTLNAAVIGNRFAVQRAVAQAMRSALRLGSRR